MKMTDVIRRPLVTEKTSILREDGRTIVFQVATSANKIQIRQAVKELFKVDVTDVSTMNVRGKLRRRRTARAGKDPDWKKAIVTLKDGDKIVLT